MPFSCNNKQSPSTQNTSQSCVVDNVIHKIKPVHIPPSLPTPGNIYPELNNPDISICEIKPLKPSEVYPNAITTPITEPIDHQARAAEYYVIGISLGGYSILGPIVTPAILVGTGGYILFKIIQDAKRKAAKKQVQKEFEEEQNKNSGGGGPKKPDDDKNKKGLNKKQQAELDKQKRYPAQNEPVGNKGVYEDAGYHHPNSQGAKSKSPKNGQKALNNSVEVEDSSGRVGVSDGEFVVLKETSPGKYHGHVRNWEELTGDMQEALKKYKLASPKGKIL